ncbi:MAG: site-specific integrase [Limnothrix sp. RL_2_0]|nr:site-specific integrase [Limnothrix sp. RL_2_0]
MKNNRFGKAGVLSKEQELLIRENLPKLVYQIAFDIARFTGERMGAILQLQNSDVYDPWLQPLTYVNFRKQTRKQSAGKEAKTRQVPMHPKLAESLKGWRSPSEKYLFPSPRGSRPISFSSYDKAFRTALKAAGLGSEGFSTHSTRRTTITRLSRLGIGDKVVQKIIGHSDIRTTLGYIEDDPAIERQAIQNL